jgi:transketolase
MHQQYLIRKLEKKALSIRRKIIRIMANGKKGHLGGSLSVADIIAALYFHQMNINPKDPEWENRDRLIMSKGHSVLAQYAALAETGFFQENELDNIKNLGSFLQGHPDRIKTPGVEASTGSLGQGLSIACGVALAAKIQRKKYHVYAIIGDGESNEGMIWEAAFFAANYHLDNLIGITDLNSLMATGRTIVGLLAPKWKAFGWETKKIDGHNMSEILDALDWSTSQKEKPVMIICKTVKGKGISFAEDSPLYHHCSLSSEQYQKANEDLKEMEFRLNGKT